MYSTTRSAAETDSDADHTSATRVRFEPWTQPNTQTQGAIRARRERAVEKLLVALDAMDAEIEDIEDEHEDGDESDYEPSLAAPEAAYLVYPLTPGGPLAFLKLAGRSAKDRPEPLLRSLGKLRKPPGESE